MLTLCKFQVHLKRTERQIVDLQLAGRLWQLYDTDADLFPILQEMCGIGAKVSLESILTAGIAVSKDLWPDAGFLKMMNDFAGFLDCFKGEPVTKVAVEGMRDNPRAWFTDMGKVGGYFRFHAELAEKLAELVLKHAHVEPVDAKGFIRKLLAERAEAQTQGKPFHSIKAAQIHTLSREFQGRLSHQANLEARGIRTEPDPRGGVGSVIYSGKLFDKWNPKGDEKYQETKETHTRAREGTQKGATIPVELRDFIRVPTHLVGKYDWTSGISKWKQMAWDRMWIISQLYGLPPGATISGTTTDHMFTIYEILTETEANSAPSLPESPEKAKNRRLARALTAYKPFLHLIPLVQMVPQMHHSLAETGAALTLNDFIHYQVGFYTTLLTPEAETLQPELHAKVMRLLREAERSVTHMYAASDGGVVFSRKVGGYAVDITNQSEVDKFKKAAMLTPETVVRDFESIPGPITIEYVHQRARQIDPNIRPLPTK